MGRYLTARLLHSALTLVGASIFIFVLLRVIPGDPAAMLLPEGTPQSVVDQMNREMGLKKPIYTQYALFIRNIATGDFGDSFQYRAPATAVIGERMMATVALTASAMAVTILFGVTIGIVAAVKRGSAYDYGGTIFAVLGQALPNFWLGIMLILFFGVRLRWLPTSGFDGPKSLILPAVTLAAYPTAFVARLNALEHARGARA